MGSVHLGIGYRDDDRHQHCLVEFLLPAFQKAGNDVCPFHNDIRSFLERSGDQRLDAHRHCGDLFLKPDDELFGR